ncbi:MAG: DUF6504 family protein [Dictyoglomaceae bacterium]
MKNLYHYPIRVNLENTGIPSSFIWNGRYYRIQKIEKSWELTYKALGEKGYKYYFRVKAEDQNYYYDIAYDSLLNEWFLERVDSKSFLLVP